MEPEGLLPNLQVTANDAYLRQINPVHILQSYFFKTKFNIVTIFGRVKYIY
jgi:hypothetical protein